MKYHDIPQEEGEPKLRPLTSSNSSIALVPALDQSNQPLRPGAYTLPSLNLPLKYTSCPSSLFYTPSGLSSRILERESTPTAYTPAAQHSAGFQRATLPSKLPEQKAHIHTQWRMGKSAALLLAHIRPIQQTPPQASTIRHPTSPSNSLPKMHTPLPPEDAQHDEENVPQYS